MVDPIEVETLREQMLVLERKLKATLRENEMLRERLARYLRRLFGPKSEKIDPAQLGLAFEEVLEIVGAQPEAEANEHAREAADDEAGTTTQKVRRKGAHGRRPLPKDLPRIRVEYHPDEEDRACHSCKQALVRIGEETSEELDWQPATMTVTEHVRVKYACKGCQEGVVIGVLPPRPIEKGRPGSGLLAHVLVSKYADHLPLHRQEAIFERSGVELSRQTLCDWVAGCAQSLAPIVLAQKRSVLGSFVIHSDDTGVLCQENFRGAGKRKSFLWAYVGDRAEVVYDFTLSHGQEGPKSWLGDWSGYLQVDAYSGYNEVLASGAMVEVGCWAHARRKYFEALESNLERASRMLVLIGELYKIEREAKAHGLDAERRCVLRRERAPPILERIRVQIDEDRSRVLPKSSLGEAATYANNQWLALSRYLEDGRLSIDNMAAERAVRGIAVGRKNWLFAGSPKGGERAAVIYSLVETCKLQRIEPFAYLRDVLDRRPTHAPERMAELTPRLWKAARSGEPAD